MSSPEEDQAYGLLQEYANGFMVSQVGRREGRPAGLAGIHGGRLGGVGSGYWPLHGEGSPWGDENVLATGARGPLRAVSPPTDPV